jgi:hypothetical protein
VTHVARAAADQFVRQFAGSDTRLFRALSSKRARRRTRRASRAIRILNPLQIETEATMKRYVLSALLTLPLTALGVGCGQASKPAGSVTGTVRYHEQPLPSVDVNFFSADKGTGARATADASGNFRLPEPLDAGSYRVYITPPAPQTTGGPDGSPPPDVAKVDVPEKYLQMESSDLNVEVKPGENKVSLDLQ